MIRRMQLIAYLLFLPLVLFGQDAAKEETKKSADTPFVELDLDDYASGFFESITVRAPDTWDQRNPAYTMSKDRSYQVITLAFPMYPNWFVDLVPKDTTDDYIVEQMVETSVSICDEGPCITLTEWTHHLSKWRHLEHKEGDTYQMIDAWMEGSLEFPSVQADEIRQAAQDHAQRVADQEGGEPDNRWGALASQCESAESPPCLLAVSRYIIKISVRTEGIWDVVKAFQIIPAGGD